MPPSNPCGQHTELAANNAIRVTRCACGTVHVTLLSSGVTVRVTQDTLRHALVGLTTAVEKLDEVPVGAIGSSTIN